MRRHDLNTRRDKISFINKVREGEINFIEPVADMILIHGQQYLSMRTGRQWSRDEYIKEHGADIERAREK